MQLSPYQLLDRYQLICWNTPHVDVRLYLYFYLDENVRQNNFEEVEKEVEKKILY